MTLWQGRFESNTNEEAFNLKASISFDRRLAELRRKQQKLRLSG